MYGKILSVEFHMYPRKMPYPYIERREVKI